jgi:hypothetical protein
MKLQSDVGRSCGSCNACCKVFLVPEVGKTDGNWCQHCVVGSGCAIYQSRPFACREFACAWLNGLGDDNLRPDRFGVMIDTRDIELDNGRVVGFIHLFEMKEGSLSTAYIQQLIKDNMDQGFVVVCHFESGNTYEKRASLQPRFFTPNEVAEIEFYLTA